MGLHNVVGYSSFRNWELKMVRGKARGLIGKHGFVAEDFPDLEQELLIHVHLKRGTGATWERREASERTVMSRILDNRIRDMIDAAHTNKRRVHTATSSLSEEIVQSDDGDRITMEDTIAEDRSRPLITHSWANEGADLHRDLLEARRRLSERQRAIADLLTQGMSITETAGQLGMPRTTLNREIERMRAIFYKANLQGYL